jgi:hypothetical protein
MIRTAFKLVAALTGLVLVSSSVLHADSSAPLAAKKKAPPGHP